MSSLVNVLDAIVAGLATVTNLSTSAVKKYDYRAMDLPYSVVVTPAFAGQQTLETADGEWRLDHRINLLLTVTQRGDIQDLLGNAATMVPLILAWFRSNNDLGLSDCLGCHLEPITWAAENVVENENGVLRKEITFTVTVTLTV